MSVSVFASNDEPLVQDIKSLSATISKSTKNFRNYDSLTRREKRTLKNYLLDVENILASYRMLDDSSTGTTNKVKFYCDGRSLYSIASGAHQTTLQSSTSCISVLNYQDAGKVVYCEGRSLYKISDFTHDRTLSSSSACNKVAQLMNQND